MGEHKARCKMTPETKLKELIDTIIDTHGCSRLIAALSATGYAVAEYNKIQEDLGCPSREMVVDANLVRELRAKIAKLEGLLIEAKRVCA